MRNEAEDSYFNKEIVIANRFDKQLELFDSTLYTGPPATSSRQYFSNEAGNGNLIIHLDKQVFNTREKVTFSIETKSIPGDSITRLSVSISDIVPGITDKPSISASFNNVNKPAIALEQRQNHRNYHPEVKGSVIEGRVSSMQQYGNQSVTGTRHYQVKATQNRNSISQPVSIYISLISGSYYYGIRESYCTITKNCK